MPLPLAENFKPSDFPPPLRNCRHEEVASKPKIGRERKDSQAILMRIHVVSQTLGDAAWQRLIWQTLTSCNTEFQVCSSIIHFFEDVSSR